MADSKMEKAIFKLFIKDFKLQNINRNQSVKAKFISELSLTSFKNKFRQKQLALFKSYASAQSENPDQS